MTSKFLCFCLGEERYLADISSVEEIIPYQKPNPVPGTNEVNLGMLNIRGDIITLFSGHALLALKQGQDTKDQKIIIFNYSGLKFGVVVDDLDEIIHLDTTEEEHTAESGGNPIITGTLTHHGSLLIMIDFSRCEAITNNYPSIDESP